MAAVACLARLGDHHALAGRQAVGLDHDRQRLAGDDRPAPRGVREAAVGGGGDAELGAEVLGEALRALEPGGRLGRSEDLDAAAARSSASPATSGASGPITTKPMSLSLQNWMTAAWSSTSSVDALGDLGDAGVAGGAVELAQQRAGRNRPRQRVLAPAGADQEYVHGRALAKALEISHLLASLQRVLMYHLTIVEQSRGKPWPKPPAPPARPAARATMRRSSRCPSCRPPSSGRWRARSATCACAARSRASAACIRPATATSR